MNTNEHNDCPKTSTKQIRLCDCLAQATTNTAKLLDIKQSDVMRNALSQFVNEREVLHEQIKANSIKPLDLEFSLPSIEGLSIPTRFSDEHNSNILPVVSAKSEVAKEELNDTLIISRSFDYAKFGTILRDELVKGDLLLLGKGSKVIGRVNSAFTTIRKVIEDSWRINKTRLSVVSNNGSIVDVTSRSGWNKIVEEARQNSESRATVQYVTKVTTARITAPLNYYLRELDSLQLAIEKVYTLVYQYRKKFLKLTTKEVHIIAERVFNAIQKDIHGIYPYSLEEITFELLDLKDRIDEIETEKTVRVCMGCKETRVGKSTQFCKPCLKIAMQNF